MRKIFLFLLLLAFAAIYGLSLSSVFTRDLTAMKIERNSVFGSDRYAYGDLYGFAWLADFKHRESPISGVPVSSSPICSNNQIDLYTLCDSYLWGSLSSDTLYCGVNRFTMIKLNTREELVTSLDSTRKNILLLEISERNFRSIFYDNYLENFIKIQKRPVNAIVAGKSSPLVDLWHFLFNRDIERNLISNVWDYRLLTPIREFRADINYKLFNRTDSDVTVSSDGKYLFYAPTIDRSVQTSSFSKLDESEIELMVKVLNKVYDKYISLGFDEVYLSIIPNPVTVIEPVYRGYNYNQLIPAIQNSEEMRMPVIDIVTDFKNEDRQIYHHSDTHWNMTGATIWLNKINRTLNKHI